jgi:hypothetical protein
MKGRLHTEPLFSLLAYMKSYYFSKLKKLGGLKVVTAGGYGMTQYLIINCMV